MTDALIQPAPAKNLRIHRVEVFKDSRGITIEAHTPCGTKDAPLIMAKSTFMSRVNVPVDINGQTRPMPIVVPITADDIYGAFEVADEQINERAPKVVEQLMEEMRGEMRRQSLKTTNLPHPPSRG